MSVSYLEAHASTRPMNRSIASGAIPPMERRRPADAGRIQAAL